MLKLQKRNPTEDDLWPEPNPKCFDLFWHFKSVTLLVVTNSRSVNNLFPEPSRNVIIMFDNDSASLRKLQRQPWRWNFWGFFFFMKNHTSSVHTSKALILTHTAVVCHHIKNTHTTKCALIYYPIPKARNIGNHVNNAEDFFFFFFPLCKDIHSIWVEIEKPHCTITWHCLFFFISDGCLGADIGDR